MVNYLNLCNGSITRQRTTIRGEDKSILDLYIVCSKVLVLVKHMEVDHVGKYKLTSYKHKKIVPTDHSSVTLVMDLEIPTMKPERIVNYDFRNVEGQMQFFHMRYKNKYLSEVFSTGITFQDQVTAWRKRIKSCFFMSFPKIRHRKRK